MELRHGVEWIAHKKFVFRNPSQSSPILTILFSCWFIITSLLLFYLYEQLFLITMRAVESHACKELPWAKTVKMITLSQFPKLSILTWTRTCV